MRQHHPGSLSEVGLARRMMRNAAALVVGRHLNALGRLVVVAMIVRMLGASVFGEYALLVAWLTIAEWILDFGTTEVFVREANRDPDDARRLSRIFLTLKLFQAPVAALLVTGGLLAMQYSGRIVVAGMVASASLFFLALQVHCHASLKASLLMEREAVAELVSVLVLMALVALLPYTGWGLLGLMSAYVVSRAVFMAGCLVLSRGVVRLAVRGVERPELAWAVRASWAIGVIGFVVVLHNAADLLVLSRFVSLEELAVYSAAQRFTLPVMMGMHAISVSFYPVLAFVDSPEEFRTKCRQAAHTTIVLGGLALVCLWTGAELLLAILDPEFVAGADILRILATMSVIKAVSLVIGPVLFLVGAENHALAYMTVALLSKVALLVLLTPAYGPVGAAFGTLAVEALVLGPLTLHLVYRRTGFALRVLDVGRVAVVVGATLLLTGWLVPDGRLVAVAVAAPLYVLGALATGSVRLREIGEVLGRGGSR